MWWKSREPVASFVRLWHGANHAHAMYAKAVAEWDAKGRRGDLPAVSNTIGENREILETLRGLLDEQRRRLALDIEFLQDVSTAYSRHEQFLEQNEKHIAVLRKIVGGKKALSRFLSIHSTEERLERNLIVLRDRFDPELDMDTKKVIADEGSHWIVGWSLLCKILAREQELRIKIVDAEERRIRLHKHIEQGIDVHRAEEEKYLSEERETAREVERIAKKAERVDKRAVAETMKTIRWCSAKLEEIDRLTRAVTECRKLLLRAAA